VPSRPIRCLRCGFKTTVVAGIVPTVCESGAPSCKGQPGHWRFDDDAVFSVETWCDELTEYDVLFLKVNRISPV